MQAGELDFQGVYDAFYARILRYLSRLVGEGEAEDLAQEVFLRVSQGLSEFRGEAQISTWLYRIATNAAIDRMRAPAFRQKDFAALDEECNPQAPSLDGGPLPDQEVMRKEMYDCFGQYVGQLPPAYRAVVILSELEELPNREIAEVLGLSLETVKIRLHRGRTLLFQQLQKNCKAEDWL